MGRRRRDTTITVARREEADIIHRAVFRRPAGERVAERFARVSSRLDALAGEEDVRRYYEAITRIGDVEAVEVAARARGVLPLLTKKVHAMVYLAETVPGNQEFFVANRRSRAAAYASLLWGGVRTAVKLVKGLVLLSRVPRA